MTNTEGLFVEFYEDAYEITHQSEVEGRPVYEQREFVRIIVPGNMTNVIERVCDEADKRRFPHEYARFKQGSSEKHEGTLLTVWPPINKSQIKESNYFSIYTVEQLSMLSDYNITKMGMGWQDLRRKAISWLAAAKDGAIVNKQSTEIEQLKQELASMREQLNATPDEPRRGRPRKEVVEAVEA